MSSRKYIVFLDTSPRFGGAQRSLLDLSKRCHKDWVPMILAASEDLLEAAKAANIPCLSVKTHHFGRKIKDFFVFMGDCKEIRGVWKKSPLSDLPKDRVVLHANCLRSALVAVMSGCPFPIVTHSRDFMELAWVRKFVARRSREVVAVSNALAKSWENDGVKVTTVHNGLDVSGIQHTIPDKHLFMNRPTALQVAHFSPWKRHDLFLESLSVVRGRWPEIYGTIVGSAFDFAQQKYLDGLQKRTSELSFHASVGFVCGEINALPFIAGADLLVSPVPDEPFGRTVLEALALGKPVVAINSGGTAEILAGCPAATLCDPEPTSIAEAIASWQMESRRIAVRAAAMRWATKFTIETTAKNMTVIWNKIVPD